MKQILILTADAGFGHRSAANAVAAALRETYGDVCAVEIVNPLEDKRVPALVRDGQADYDRLAREMPKLYKLGYEAVDGAVLSTVVDAALTVMLFEVLRDLVRRFRPDAIVTTYPLYQAPLGAVSSIDRCHVPLITVVTDLVDVHRLWFHETADLCLVATETARDQALEYGLDPHKVQVTGIPVCPELAAEKRDPAAIRAELGWQIDLPMALAVGSKRVGHLGDVLRVLNHSGLSLQLAIVAGGDDALYRQLQETEWHTVTYLYNFVTHMPTLMHAADSIICKAGGLIIAEALACGLPIVLVDVLPGQEAGNARYVTQGGAGELALDPIVALEIMSHWLAGDRALLAERAQNARRLGRPRAAFEVAERAWSMATRGSSGKGIRQAGRRLKLSELLRRNGISPAE
jgi:1,2-diacylglycerol 3-beta-galactosyltransferase